MDTTWAAHLKNEGISDATLKFMDEQELTEAILKRGWTYEALTAAGFKPGPARILADLYPQASAAQPVQSAALAALPTTIHLTTGNPREMRTLDLLTAVANGERDPEYINTLSARLRGFVRQENGEGIDIPATMELNEEIGDEPLPAWYGKMPVETLAQVLQKQRFANPLNPRVALVKGDLWFDVSEQRRIIAAYARLTNEANNLDDEAVAQALLSEKLLGRYERWERAYTIALGRNDALALQARGEIYYRPQQEGGRGRSAIPFVATPAATVTRTHSTEVVAAQVDAPTMPVFPPAVPEDFRTLTRLYLQNDKPGMEDFLYHRGLYLEMTDLEPRYIENVPFEALCLLRAGSGRSTFKSANSIGEPGWLEQAVGMRRAELLCQGDFYQALRQSRPDPSDPLVLWCSSVLFSDRFAAGNTVRPNPHSRPGVDWRGRQIITYRS